MAGSCQTVYIEQVCSLSAVCSPKMDLEKFGTKYIPLLLLCVCSRNKHILMSTFEYIAALVCVHTKTQEVYTRGLK